MLLMGARNLGMHGLLSGHCSAIDIQLDGRERQEEAFHHVPIDWICWNRLADRDMILLAQGVAEIARAMFVLHDHFVPALSAVDDALQQGSAITRDPAR